MSLEWKWEGVMDGDSADAGEDELTCVRSDESDKSLWSVGSEVPWEADSRGRVMHDGKSGCWPSERKRRNLSAVSSLCLCDSHERWLCDRQTDRQTDRDSLELTLSLCCKLLEFLLYVTDHFRLLHTRKYRWRAGIFTFFVSHAWNIETLSLFHFKWLTINAPTCSKHILHITACKLHRQPSATGLFRLLPLVSGTICHSTSRLQNLGLSSAVASRLISLGAAFRDTLTVVVPEKWLSFRTR